MKLDIRVQNDYRDYFRNKYVINEAGGRFLGITNGYFYLTLVLFIITMIPVFLLFQIKVFKTDYLYLTILYFLICNLVEYVLHRFPMHKKIKGLEFMLEHVTIHHRFYKEGSLHYERARDYMAVFLPILYLSSISIIIFVISLGVYLISNFDNALFFCFFAYSYYLLYEGLHFAYHAKDDSFIKQFKVIKKLASFHIRHHETELMNQCNFNISFPIFDYVFKTNFKEKKN